MTGLNLLFYGRVPDTSEVLKTRGALNVQSSLEANSSDEHKRSFAATNVTDRRYPQRYYQFAADWPFCTEELDTRDGRQEVNEVGGLMNDVGQSDVDGGPASVSTCHVQHSTFKRCRHTDRYRLTDRAITRSICSWINKVIGTHRGLGLKIDPQSTVTREIIAKPLRNFCREISK